MESIPRNVILNFNKNTLQDVRKQYNLNSPGRMDEAIDILNTWIQKQAHFKKKNYERDYLERIIIAAKGSIEKAKTRLDKSCTLKTMMPKYFIRHNVKDQYFTDYFGCMKAYALPKMTEDHCRVLLVNVVDYKKMDTTMLFKYSLFTSFVCEYMKTHDYNNGCVAIIDYRNVDVVEILPKLSPVEIQNCWALYVDCFGMRIKGIHFISPSKAVELVINFIGSLISVKLKDRLHSHKTIEDLYKYVDKDILPIEYGGSEKTFEEYHNDWLDALSDEKNIEHLVDIYKANTDESMRSKDKFNEEYMGMPGTFRTLCVD